MDALRVLSQSGMSLIDPLDLYLAFAPFFFRVLQTHLRFFFLKFFFFICTHSWVIISNYELVPIHGLFHPIYGVLSWFMGLCTLFKGPLFWTCNPFKFGVATMSTTKFLLNNMAFYFIIKWHIIKFDPNLF